MDAIPLVMTLTRGRPRYGEGLIHFLLLAASFISVVTTLGIIAVLAVEATHFFQEVSMADFLFGTQWNPLIEPRRYGVLPLLNGTLMVTFGSCLVSIPFGVATALYMSEYAGHRTRSLLKPLIEILAGIPTVVYGYFALFFLTPLIRTTFDPMLLAAFGEGHEVGVYNAMSASIAIGIMTIPVVASLSDDALRSVPDSLRQGGFAMGATKLEVSTSVLIPAALSGILASCILALSRAIGETMIVVLAAGATPTLSQNPFQSIETMTAYIVQVSLGDTPYGTLEYYTLFAVAGLLFLMTLGLNILAFKIIRRFKENYE
jgi:phosphate transport system permease protein